MAGAELKTMFKSFRYRDEPAFRAAAERIIAEERTKKHGALADDLQRLLGPSPVARPVEMPVDKDSRMPLARIAQAERRLDSMILDDSVRTTLNRIITEVAAWPALDAAGLPRRNRMLLSGPPGCGKTTVAESIAAELGRPLVIAKVESLVNSHLGKTGENIGSLFDYAAAAPTVLLLDEFDSIGRSRDSNDVGEMKRVTNTVLQLIENFRGDSLIIAATNYADDLDDAMWRRFDHVAIMPLPSAPQIDTLIAKMLGKTIGGAADKLLGLPHAAVEYLGHGALRNAVLAGRERPGQKDVDDALEETLGRRWSSAPVVEEKEAVGAAE